ncbi:hypothetical protein CHS0354_004605 [Potamilus streckersoni]|uniref:Uncharacterized protein n=1 Tax=Potamilus streckersoni TaxID=2493646 RepID=A0AAE0S553_9BIVA|nr:hypothetical protein CHS0354_004605 [Potamilus streckersoni]
MAGHKLPPMVVRGQKEIPLDLSVRKTDDDDGILSVASQIVRTDGNSQLTEVYQTAVNNAESSELQTDGLYAKQNPSSVSNCSNVLSTSAILPKKRKNLWRPYDVSCFEMDRDLDSIMSDSSNSSQDQDNASDSMTMTYKMDPVKRRKLEILRYSCYERSNSPLLVKESKDGGESVAGFETVSPCSAISVNADTHIDDDHEKSSSKFNHFYSPLFESRERLMSGLKKKDIFGLSFRITSQPSFSFHHKEDNILPSSKSEDTNIVCVDNNKTYFQLQTVKKPPSEQVSSHAQGSHFQLYGCPKVNTTRRNSSGNFLICSLTNNSPGEILSSSQIGQNRISTPIVKSNRAKDDDTDENDKSQIKHVGIVPPDVSPNTTFCCTLRHLIQDIEDEEEVDNSRSNNDISDKTARNIAKLLQQCNSVKLTAIDLLMSSVNINGEERRYSPKSSRIQQMLKGEKPKMVSMLDIVELQVEVGIGI